MVGSMYDKTDCPREGKFTRTANYIPIHRRLVPGGIGLISLLWSK